MNGRLRRGIYESSGRLRRTWTMHTGDAFRGPWRRHLIAAISLIHETCGSELRHWDLTVTVLLPLRSSFFLFFVFVVFVDRFQVIVLDCSSEFL